MSDLLKGKNALITGGGSGIGQKIVTAFAKEGANVIIADISKEAAEKTRDEVLSSGGKAIACVYDVSKVELAKDFVDGLEKEFGQIDILVNNAGISYCCSVLEITPQMWDRVNNINLRGGFFLTQTVFSRMLERKEGRIINIASISGDRPADRADAAYCASKAGVIMMTKVFAKAAKDTAITVNSVSPGVIDTPLSVSIGSTVNSDKIPMGRMGKPEEVADACVFLASELASYVSGQNIRVNGGQWMG